MAGWRFAGNRAVHDLLRKYKRHCGMRGMIDTVACVVLHLLAATGPSACAPKDFISIVAAYLHQQQSTLCLPRFGNFSLLHTPDPTVFLVLHPVEVHKPRLCSDGNPWALPQCNNIHSICSCSSVSCALTIIKSTSSKNLSFSLPADSLCRQE